MCYCYDLTDSHWQRLADFFPNRYRRGRPWKDHRRLINSILWHLHTGALWPDTPARYGPWQTVYDRFNRWRKDGTWANILDALLRHMDKAGPIDRDLWCFDGTIWQAACRSKLFNYRHGLPTDPARQQAPETAGWKHLTGPAPTDRDFGRPTRGPSIPGVRRSRANLARSLLLWCRLTLRLS